MNEPFRTRAPAPVRFTCPNCKADAEPGPAAHDCARCHQKFVNYWGALGNPAVRPLMLTMRPAETPRIKVKSAGLLLMTASIVDAMGVSSGPLDPVTGLIPLDQAGVAFADMWAITVWRRISWVDAIVACVVPIPLTVLCVAAAVKFGPGFLLVAVVFAALAAWLLYRAIGVRAHWMRIEGSSRALAFRFDRPGWRRKKFYEAVVTRSGNQIVPIP